MKKTMKVTYEDALEVAYHHWVEFYDETDKFDAVKDERSADWREWRQRELRALACSSCTAEWMLCDMFGVSEERVHKDLVAMRAVVSPVRR